MQPAYGFLSGETPCSVRGELAGCVAVLRLTGLEKLGGGFGLWNYNVSVMKECFRYGWIQVLKPSHEEFFFASSLSLPLIASLLSTGFM